MNKLSSRQVVVFLTLILTIIVGLGWYYLMITGFSFLFMILGLVVFFLITYYIIQFAIHKFILEKIRPIYKIIDFVPHKEKKEKLKLTPGFVELSDVEQDVEKWAQNQRQEIERLKEMERYRKDFVGNVSHELKTPIFNIQGYILTLLEGGLEDPNINKLYLNRTEKSIDRMISIVEDLESINKLETGELIPKFSVFDIVKIVDDVYEMRTEDFVGVH